jgi:DNA invertase Pin-like site-specific DNA recombinase
MAKQKQQTPATTAVYLRVSTGRQKDASQEHEVRQYLTAHGITDIMFYRDTMTGSSMDRPELNRLQKDIFAGRVASVVVQRLDRLGRRMLGGINLLAEWCERGIRVVSVTQQLDLGGPVGKLIAAVLLAVAEMELEVIRERTRAGMAAAKARGVRLGRRPGTKARWSLAKRVVDPQLARSLRSQGASVADIATKFGSSRGAVYAALREDSLKKECK